MSKIIYKYILTSEKTVISLPSSVYKILSIQMQNGDPVAWIEVDLNQVKPNAHQIAIVQVLTGELFEEGLTYIDTILIAQGSIVLHFYV